MNISRNLENKSAENAFLSRVENEMTKTEIRIIEGKKPEIVDACEQVIVNSGDLYIFGDVLVRILESKDDSNLNSTRILSVDSLFLVDYLMSRATFIKYNTKKEKWVEVDLALDYANTLLARRNLKTQQLRGIIHSPTIRKNGTILDKPGFDKATGLFASFNPDDFPSLLEKPSFKDALNALEILKKPLAGFAFAEASDLATAISAMITPLTRHCFEFAPLFLFDSPKMGCGKGLLIQLIAMMATSRNISVMSQVKSSDEERKRLIAILIEGLPIVCIDNVQNELNSDTLCTALTMPKLTDRLLGKSQMISASTKVTFFATGIDVLVSGDLTRRVLPCIIDPGVEKPYERDFSLHIPSFAKEHRGELVIAALTIIRAYQVAGCPKQNLTTFGSFEEWSNLIRSALVWVGLADSCSGLARWERVDPIRQELTNVLELWDEELGSNALTVSELISKAKDCELYGLHQALLDVAGDGNGINSRRLGCWLTSYVNRIEAGYRLEDAGKKGTRNKYRVRNLNQVS